MEKLREGLLIGLGNPLLDISATVDEGFLQKYGLHADNAIMAEAEHEPIYKEIIDKYSVEYIAGGSVQNTLRTIQWILKKPKVTTYFGAVGSDKYANTLKEIASNEGVNVRYQYTESAPTGCCAVMITGHHRSLCANLAAATKFTPDHLDEPENRKLIETAKVYYVSGFFLAVSLPAILKLAEQALAEDKVFVMNLSAPFVSQFYKNELAQVLPYVDILFGNTTESHAFAKSFDLDETDMTAIALKMQNFPKKNANKSRIVVLTQSKDPVILVKDGKILEIPVKPLPEEKIVDTNGAGDAFTGGFLAQYLLGQPFDVCIRCGMYAAREVIQASGCTFPREPDSSSWLQG